MLLLRSFEELPPKSLITSTKSIFLCTEVLFFQNIFSVTMNTFSDNGNNTISLNNINAIMSLISLMSTNFLINSFTLITDLEMPSVVIFMKIASQYYVSINYDKNSNGFAEDKNRGYIIIEKPDFDFSKVINTHPKLIAAIFKMDDKIPPKLSQLVIPPSVSFFIVQLTEDPATVLPSETSQEASAKCLKLYKPISVLPLKTFPMMFYGGQSNPKWIWEREKMSWNSYLKETRDMRGITITIALASYREKKQATQIFWRGRNSFFWKALKDYLRFRAIVHFQSISPQAVKSITSIYLTLLITIADGLGVLPVISSERDHHLGYIVTGLDAKYHLLVRTPQYVHSWQSTFKPFTSGSWMCLGLAILLITITLRIVTYNQNLLTDLSSCCLTIFGFVCSQGCPNIPKTLSARLVCYTALLFSILIYQFYTSNFYSLLSTKEVSLPFNSLEQFISKGTHAIYVHPDTAIYAHIVNSKSGIFKKLWDEFLKKDPSHQLKSDTRGKSLNKVCKGTGAILGLPFQTLYLSDLRCKLVPVNSGYFPANIVTVVRKNFPFKSQFKFVHLRLLEAGISHKFRDEYLNLEQQHKIKRDVINEPVSLEHVAFLLAFHAVAVILSWIVLIFEVIISKSFKSKKIK